MLGDNNRRWPAQGEIDVMEILGQTPSTVHGSLIFSRNGTAGFRTGSYRLPAGQSFADGYHTFAIEWDPEAVRFYADDQLYATHTRASLPAGSTWAYDGPFYVIMDLGVGGVAAGRPDSSTVFPSQMKIDYVRVFKRSDGAAS
jgi:beta-glucanase (GH16 family)